MYIKKLKKKYQEKWENAYLIVENARASMALRWALDPSQYYIACFTHYIGKILGKIPWSPLDQILDRLLRTQIHITLDFFFKLLQETSAVVRQADRNIKDNSRIGKAERL